MPRTNYLGLNMDAAMVPRIIAAIRGLYPDLVQPTDSDNRAVQLVLHRIITEHVASWEARAAADPDAAAKAANDAAVGLQKAADAQARTDAGDMTPTAAT